VALRKWEEGWDGIGRMGRGYEGNGKGTERAEGKMMERGQIWRREKR
jgi:hypothetical protein